MKNQIEIDSPARMNPHQKIVYQKIMLSTTKTSVTTAAQKSGF
jgi:hypothetical protein